MRLAGHDAGRGTGARDGAPSAEPRSMRRIFTFIVAIGAVAFSQAHAASTPAAVALTKGDDQAALKAAEAGLVKQPNDFFLLYAKGSAQAGLGLVDDAVGTLKKAESVAPRKRGTKGWRSGRSQRPRP